jgi:hypothetical protein
MRDRLAEAVRTYWQARGSQASRQKDSGVVDTGARGEVVGGQHLNGFRDLLCELILEAGFRKGELRFADGVEVPGFYRPTKKWDIVVIRENRLCAAIEMKSQVGPSFGNNFNNRTEEAVGSSVDLWRAFKEGVLGAHAPWVGYFFFLEDAEGSREPVRVATSQFPPDPIFTGTSYAKRYEILCQRMVLERNYSAAALVLSCRGSSGTYSEPSPALGFERFVRALYGHLIGCV